MADLSKLLRTMKRILILLLALICFSSCATFRPQQRSTFAYFLDYRPYTSEGFFISPDPYTGEFESLGELYIEVLPEQKAINIEDEDKYDNVMYWGTQAYGFERISHAELLEMAVHKAVLKDANGIANLKIEKCSESSTNGSIVSSRIVYKIYGLCIKIK